MRKRHEEAWGVDDTESMSIFFAKGFKKLLEVNEIYGPMSVVDWDGHTAPSGMFQVEEEEIGSCKRCLKGLELDKPLATCAADGGSAWPEIVKSFHQCHVEDIFHNAKNADKKYNFIQISCLKCINHYIQYKWSCLVKS